MAVIQRTLPASWYTNQKYHGLERRAVFLRSWFFLGTINKFKDAQSVCYEIAQVELTAKVEDLAGDPKVRVFSDVNVCSMLHVALRHLLNICGTERRIKVSPDTVRACLYDNLISCAFI